MRKHHCRPLVAGGGQQERRSRVSDSLTMPDGYGRLLCSLQNLIREIVEIIEAWQVSWLVPVAVGLLNTLIHAGGVNGLVCRDVA